MSHDVINLSSYVRQESCEKINRKGWVDYGEKNLFPQYLHELYVSSPTHNALTNTIGQLIASSVLVPGDFEKEHVKAARDLKEYGGCYLEVNWSLLGDNIASVKHLPFTSVRVSVGDNPTTVWYSKDWGNMRGDNKPIEIDLYNSSTRKENPTQVMSVSSVISGNDYYPKPDYIGAVDWIEIESSIAKFHANNVRNNFSPVWAIQHHDGEPTPEEKIQNRALYERTLTGTDGAKLIVTYDGGKEDGVEFKSFETTDEDKKYDFLSRECTDKIMVGHRVTSPSLFGVRVAGTLGDSSEKEISAGLFDEQVVQPYGKVLYDAYVTLSEYTGWVGLEQTSSNPFADKSDVDQSYTGIQISSALEVIAKVNLGELTVDQAIVIIEKMLGFENDDAVALFKDAKQSLSAVLTDDLEKFVIDYVSDKGELMGDDWDYFEEDIEDEKNEGFYHSLAAVKLYDSTYRNPQDKSPWGDAGLYKLRYVYNGRATDKSRAFCKKMVDLTSQGYVYRYEDIIDMGESGVNSQFSPKGASTYNIFEHKGGVNCHHTWKRRIYFRKTDAGRFKPRSVTPEMENDTKVGNNPFVPQKGVEGVAPINTPSKGRKLSKFISNVKQYFDGDSK